MLTILKFKANQKKKYKTTKQTYADFPLGTKVQVITPCSDFIFFQGTEKGIVIRNLGSGGDGVIVLFDEPMEYEDGYVRREHGFDPDDLLILKRVECNCACHHD